MTTGKTRITSIDSARRGDGRFVWRFKAFHRWTHGVVMLSFFLLVVTGLPLRFNCAFWSASLMGLLGGVEMAGRLHRFGAFLTFGYFGAHLTYLGVAFIRSPDRKGMLWGPDSLIPQPHDVVDFVRQLRWFVGRGERPRFARYSYMEKFDYFAVFWGVAIIGGSGLLLWFPEFFSGSLPGWVFNVATIVHGEEALLAAGFIFTIHFFHVHLRPEKFPIDTVMFTGRATQEYMDEEHGLLSESIADHPDAGISRRAVPDQFAAPPSQAQTLVGVALGLTALAFGLVLIGMILWGASFC